MRLTLPIRTRSGDNAREHWRARASRAKAHRDGAAMGLLAALARTAPGEPAALLAELDGPGLTVTLTRVAPRELDTDGNASGMKSVRDGIADALGLQSDNDARVTWLYAQRKGPPKVYEVEVVVSTRAACPTCGGVVAGVRP